MNNSLLMPIMDDNIIMVTARFNSSHESGTKAVWSQVYQYKASKLMGLKAGSIAVAQARGWYSVVKIEEVDVPIPMDNKDTQFRWIVAPLDAQVQSLEAMMSAEQSLTSQLDRKRAEAARQQALDALGLSPLAAQAMLNAAKSNE